MGRTGDPLNENHMIELTRRARSHLPAFDPALSQRVVGSRVMRPANASLGLWGVRDNEFEAFRCVASS